MLKILVENSDKIVWPTGSSLVLTYQSGGGALTLPPAKIVPQSSAYVGTVSSLVDIFMTLGLYVTL